jgi:hypothetical protein
VLHDGCVTLLAVDADVDRLVVVEYPYRGPVRWRGPRVRELLGERFRGRRLLPDGVVEPPVDYGRFVRARGRHVRRPCGDARPGEEKRRDHIELAAVGGWARITAVLSAAGRGETRDRGARRRRASWPRR